MKPKVKFLGTILVVIVGMAVNIGNGANVAAADGIQMSKKIVHWSEVDSLQLSKEKVKSWIETRIEVAKLQNRMKENAAEFDDVVASFYEKRKELLVSQGWSVAEFDEAKGRIHAAISAMDMAEELQNSEEDYEKEIADIRANEFYTDSQKEQMIKSLRFMRTQKVEQYIKPTQNDWTAVRPYRAIFEDMTGWIAGNKSTPPDL